MNYFTGIIVFLLIWWVTIFCVLPFGLERDKTGKPEKIYALRVFLITTALSALIWGGLYVLIDSEIISFRDMANKAAQEAAKS